MPFSACPHQVRAAGDAYRRVTCPRSRPTLRDGTRPHQRNRARPWFRHLPRRL